MNTMIDYKTFKLLVYCMNTADLSQRKISKALDISLGTTNFLIKTCMQSKLINNNYQLTKSGENALEPYKVENAIIMAAGLSSRFVPLSYTRPKGLTVVKGEVLIERQIRQLQEAGIKNITIVVGYKKELFFYLKEKFNVDIVINSEYASRGNYASIYCVKERLSNTYICSSDNYFSENIFSAYNYQPFYFAQYQKGHTDERCVITDSNNKITKTYLDGQDSWILLGPAYWDKNFSGAMIPYLKNCYEISHYKMALWEHVYNDNMNSLPPLYVKKLHPCIYEFDNIDELRKFDPQYLQNCDPQIFNNICKVLNCKADDLSDFKLIEEGQTNNNFTFMCNKSKFVYRHTSKFTKSIIDRNNEAKIEKYLKDIQIESGTLYIDGEYGWKVSKWFADKGCDFDNAKHLEQCIETLQTLHNGKAQNFAGIDYVKQINNLHTLLSRDSSLYKGFFDELYPNVRRLIDYLKKDNWKKCLIHNDINEENFLICEDGIKLIDWEYAGIGDPGFDIVRLIIKTDDGINNTDMVLDRYFNGEYGTEEKAHVLACGSVAYYYWLLWAIYLESNGRNLEQSILDWYQIVKKYGRKAVELYEQIQ